MVLHELYFASLGGDGVSMEPPMQLALDANFDSVERWRDEFVAMGRAFGGGSGWVLLCFQPREGTLVNQWCLDHTHSLAGGVPILALDMYEHAYHMDSGSAAAAYVDGSVGLTSELLSLWPGSWLLSWVVAFPVTLLVLPVVRRMTAAFVKTP